MGESSIHIITLEGRGIVIVRRAAEILLKTSINAVKAVGGPW